MQPTPSSAQLAYETYVLVQDLPAASWADLPDGDKAMWEQAAAQVMGGSG